MANNWTEAQLKALNNTGSLLVSASAGSGKTTVMIERALNYLKNGGDIKRIIILTFSKASAYEMKEKLMQELLAAVSTEAEPAHLKAQIAALPFAHIATIDSYCYYLFKTYFEDIGADPQTELLDPTEEAPRLIESVTETLESLLTTDDEEFHLLVDNFVENRTISGLVEMIVNIINFTEVLADGDAFFDMAEVESASPLDSNKSVDFLLKYYRKRSAFYAPRTEQILNRVKQLEEMGLVLPDKVSDALAEYLTMLNRIARANNLEAFLTTIDAWQTPPALRFSKPYNDVRDEVYAAVKDVIKSSKAFIVEDMCVKFAISGANAHSSFSIFTNREGEAQAHNKKLLQVAKLCRNNFQQGKKQDKVATFSDMEHSALQILQNPIRANEVKASIDAIFMDEYQDTNYLQEAIINAIQSDNLFMVGDVKQSIYRFRFAEPKLFLNRRDNYDMLGNGTNVNLNDNFRSNAEVLHFVNLICDHAMTHDFGRIDYAQTARLVAGGKYPLDPTLPAVAVALFKKERETKFFPPEYTIASAPLKHDKVSKEGIYIAEKIADLVANHTIFDRATGAHRPIEYRDIAVLMRTKSASSICEQLDIRNIPYMASGFKGDKLTADIELIVALLRIVDNYKQDIPLASVMLSYFGSFTDYDLAVIRSNSPKAPFFHNALTTFNGDANIKMKIDSLLNIIRIYKGLADMMSVDALIDYILSASGYDAYLASSDSKRLQVVNTFINSIRNKNASTSISNFLKYYDSQKEIDVKLAVSCDNIVTFMSIHASKGLEFPIVFYANAHDGFSKKRITDKVLQIDADFGINLKYRNMSDKTIANTITSIAFQQKQIFEELQEQVRLMYVALTRAKFHLFISGNDVNVNCALPDGTNSTIGWIKFAAQFDSRVQKYISYPEVQEIPKVAKPMLPPTTHFKPLKLDYPYPNASATTINTKFSVSTVAKMALDEEEKVHYISTLGDTNAELGTLYHTILENIDITLHSHSEITSQISKMLENGIIDCNLSDIDINMLHNVLASEVFCIARRAKCTEKCHLCYINPRAS
ncbi:MAG: UvrD-helicase domain-containing protein [Bacillota bacterium]